MVFSSKNISAFQAKYILDNSPIILAILKKRVRGRRGRGGKSGGRKRERERETFIINVRLLNA